MFLLVCILSLVFSICILCLSFWNLQLERKVSTRLDALEYKIEYYKKYGFFPQNSSYCKR